MHYSTGLGPQKSRRSDNVETYDESSIVALACLDDFIPALVACSLENGTDTVGGYR